MLARILKPCRGISAAWDGERAFLPGVTVDLPRDLEQWVAAGIAEVITGGEARETKVVRPAETKPAEPPASKPRSAPPKGGRATKK